ncbi:hypothetical protein ABKA04_001864 [Annulohypoxylon sp. FPYF3050]
MDKTNEDMVKEYDDLRFKVKLARSKVRSLNCSDAKYWTLAAETSALAKKIYETEMHLSIQRWKEDEKTQDTEDCYEELKDREQVTTFEIGGPVQKALQSMFTASQEGLGVGNVGVGRESQSEQSEFKDSLITSLLSSHNSISMPSVLPTVLLAVLRRLLYSTRLRPLPRYVLVRAFSLLSAYHVILPVWSTPDNPRASHLVQLGKITESQASRKGSSPKQSHNHLESVLGGDAAFGPDILVAIFGTNVQGELDTPYNGLLLNAQVEAAMDDGAIVAVPDIDDDPTTEQIQEWERAEVKEYRWRIVDPEAEVLNEVLGVAKPQELPMTIRHLDGKRLSFKNNIRPRARYLYFLFIVAQLRVAWRNEYRKDPSKVLTKQLGKGFWATKGYLQRSFLLALADEIGHDTNFAENIPIEPGDDNDPDYTGVIGIAKLLQSKDNEDSDDEEPE